MSADVRVRLVMTDLPGSSWGSHRSVHVAMQRGRDVVGITPASAPRAAWEIEVTLHEDGDVRGPWVQGKRGERFVYITWGTSADPDNWGMFRRAKVMLTPVGTLLRDAARDHRMLEVGLPGTDANGGPLCAAVRPPRVSWSLVDA